MPDYDELPIGSLQHRIRALDGGQLRELMDYEREHADRTPVLELMRTRLRQLDEGAEPSPGAQEEAPEVSHGRHGSAVEPGEAAEPGTPLRHGVAGQTPHRGRP